MIKYTPALHNAMDFWLVHPFQVGEDVFNYADRLLKELHGKCEWAMPAFYRTDIYQLRVLSNIGELHMYPRHIALVIDGFIFDGPNGYGGVPIERYCRRGLLTFNEHYVVEDAGIFTKQFITER